MSTLPTSLPKGRHISEVNLEAGGALFALLNNDKDLAQQCVSRLGNNGVADLTMAAFRLGDMAREERRIRERKVQVR